jgi:hypothetical protein
MKTYITLSLTGRGARPRSLVKLRERFSEIIVRKKETDGQGMDFYNLR